MMKRVSESAPLYAVYCDETIDLEETIVWRHYAIP